MTPRRELGNGSGREETILIKSQAIKEMKLELHKAEATQVRGNGAEPSATSVVFQAVPLPFYLYSQNVEPVSACT